uniref:Uncharacterized protein n=1 Tax=Anguilla anguilla TaxID=7936 RepID=A0A0E9USJ9_ANGAN
MQQRTVPIHRETTDAFQS